MHGSQSRYESRTASYTNFHYTCTVPLSLRRADSVKQLLLQTAVHATLCMLNPQSPLAAAAIFAAGVLVGMG